MRHLRTVLLLLLAAGGACDRRRAPDPRLMVQRTLRGMFIYPGSVVVDMSAGEDAAQVTLTTSDSVEAVTGWFRRALELNAWVLQSDVTSERSVTIVAAKGQRPLWITLRPNVGGTGTTYTMIGALLAEGDSLRIRDSIK